MTARIGIRELRARLASDLESATPFEVTRHGRTAALHVPLPQESALRCARPASAERSESAGAAGPSVGTSEPIGPPRRWGIHARTA